MEILKFGLIAMERVWGGRHLAEFFGKELPADAAIGEVWEVSDRPEAQSVVVAGKFAGVSLNNLWMRHRAEIFGEAYFSHSATKFPILIKWLDARDKLSLQVHPPAEVAERWGGEPKTEVWYFAQCDAGASIYAGVKAGTTREGFEEALRGGCAADVLHDLPVREGESIFIESGRLHAIGAGNVIIEVQQNSDTTYRVFDWNRVGLDGKARELHIEKSLDCIDFGDTNPQVEYCEEVIADCPYFCVRRVKFTDGEFLCGGERFAIYGVAGGRVSCADEEFASGAFFLVPSGYKCIMRAGAGASVVEVMLPISKKQS